MASTGVGELSTSFWINFFTSAGIPAGDAANYAVIFVDNRITKDMFLDLNKEYLTDMGIARLGDIIAILKHAKQVHTQEVRDKALHSFRPPPASTPAPPMRRSTGVYKHNLELGSVSSNETLTYPRLSTQFASRIIDHHVHKEKDPPLSNTPLAQKLAALEAAKKSSVFSRLGADTPPSGGAKMKIAVNNGSSNSQTQSSVFSRLGDKTPGKAVKRPASSTSLDSLDSEEAGKPLEYAGILKSGASKTPNVTSTTGPSVKRAKPSHPNLVITRTVPVAAPKKVKSPEPQVETAGILSDYAKLEAASIKDRLGKKVVMAAATSTTGPSLPSTGASKSKSLSAPRTTPNLTVRATPSRRPGGVTVRTSMLSAAKGIKARLGPKPAVTSTSKTATKPSLPPRKPVTDQQVQDVFSRLGKKLL